MTKDLEDERRNGKEKPFNWHPPPSDTKPPETSMMCVYQFRICDGLNVYIFASTFRTVHISTPFLMYPHITTNIFVKQTIFRKKARIRMKKSNKCSIMVVQYSERGGMYGIHHGIDKDRE